MKETENISETKALKPYWLPWCGFVIAAVISWLLSDMLLRTKTGKFLIG